MEIRRGRGLTVGPQARVNALTVLTRGVGMPPGLSRRAARHCKGRRQSRKDTARHDHTTDERFRLSSHSSPTRCRLAIGLLSYVQRTTAATIWRISAR